MHVLNNAKKEHDIQGSRNTTSHTRKNSNLSKSMLHNDNISSTFDSSMFKGIG